jgi:hypothetical protein
VHGWGGEGEQQLFWRGLSLRMAPEIMAWSSLRLRWSRETRAPARHCSSGRTSRAPRLRRLSPANSRDSSSRAPAVDFRAMREDCPGEVSQASVRHTGFMECGHGISRGGQIGGAPLRGGVRRRSETGRDGTAGRDDPPSARPLGIGRSPTVSCDPWWRRQSMWSVTRNQCRRRMPRPASQAHLCEYVRTQARRRDLPALRADARRASGGVHGKPVPGGR